MLRIKEVLKEKNVSQIELAERLGMSKVGINKIINGNPTIETLEKIAEVLEIEIIDLFTSKTDQRNPIAITLINGDIKTFYNVFELKDYINSI